MARTRRRAPATFRARFDIDETADLDVCGFTPVEAQGFSQVFRLIEVAEQEVAEVFGDKPDYGTPAMLVWCERTSPAFRACRPRSLEMPEKLYRAHCRELCERVRDDEDVRPGTLAEVLWALQHASLRAPLTRPGQLLYEHIFGRLFPDDFPKAFGHLDVPVREEWPGQLDEELLEARRLARDDQRGVLA